MYDGTNWILGSDVYTDTWYHFAVTKSGTIYTLYRGAAYENSGALTDIDISDLDIGRRSEDVWYFDGLIDEVRIWDKALQPEDILNPDISVEKSGPESAYVGDIITYYYTVTNTGYVPLSNVTVSDDKAGDVVDFSGDTNNNGLLDLEEDWIFTAEYIIPEYASEYLCNIATAEGWYEEDWVSDASDEICVHTMGARTIGYWKTHSEKWCPFPSGSLFVGKKYDDLVAYFPGNGAEVDGVNPLEMLRAQLIAAELNYACFNSMFDYSRYDGGAIFGTMRDAEALLQRVYLAASGDLNAFWSDLSKQQQNNVKKIANPLKDTLEEFNEMGDEIFE